MSDRLMSRSLSRLRLAMQRDLTDALHGKHWGAPDEMTKALAAVRATFDSSEVHFDERSVAEILSVYRTSGHIAGFVDLKYACFGLGQRVGREQWSLMDDEVRFPAFLKRVDEEQPRPRRFRKCYQGLMHSYFSYDVFANPSDVAKTNWRRLQNYLRDRLVVALSAANSPTWLRTLSAHPNLVAENPCARYAEALLKGDDSELSAAAEGIGIGSSSWLWQEAMLAHAVAVSSKTDDAEFRAFLAPLLDLLDGRGEIRINQTIVARCTAQLLIRYTKCRERPEHGRLRDLAVSSIGNPWLRRDAWDAYVKSEDARKMVDGWLKRRLITDFFALLAEDGAANPRRLKYWMRFESAIEDMWFVLGTRARYDQTLELREVKRRMEGRLHYLGSGATADNNAFVMRIGPFMIVEFGLTGNACFIFNAGDLQIDPMQQVLGVGFLKSAKHIERLIHSGPWEEKFDAWLLPRLGRATTTQAGFRADTRDEAGNVMRAGEPALLVARGQVSAPVDEYVNLLIRHGVPYDDRRPKGGLLWARVDYRNAVVNARLRNAGFKYVQDKGWWRE